MSKFFLRYRLYTMKTRKEGRYKCACIIAVQLVVHISFFAFSSILDKKVEFLNKKFMNCRSGRGLWLL